MKYVVGIDIGGTNTDAVLVGQDGEIVAKIKIATSERLHESVVEAIQTLCPGKDIARIAIGTTFATNAVLERKELSQVGVIRIAGQKPTIPSGYSWPQELKELVIKKTITIDGGYRCDGSSLNSFSVEEAQKAFRILVDEGVQAIAIIGVYSPLNSHEEKLVEEIAKSLPVSCSCDIGGIGFLERESATILNAALKRALYTGFTKMEEAIRHQGISCPIFMVKNDGSIMSIQDAIQNPILTIAAGQTNSFFGASRIAKVDDAIVIDIGGTSTDIGIVTNGAAKRSCHEASIGDVVLQFPMPDALSLAIGGGTIVRANGILGPDSVGKRLKQEAYVFGGNTLTLTDIAIKAGKMHVAHAQVERVPIDISFALDVLDSVREQIAKAIRLMQGKDRTLPVIICGGGALLGYQDGMILPESAGFANAYGAAMAGVSYTVDRTVSLLEREKTLDRLKNESIAKAIEKGASPKSTQITHVEISPYAYSKEAQARVIITASGDWGS